MQTTGNTTHSYSSDNRNIWLAPGGRDGSTTTGDAHTQTQSFVSFSPSHPVWLHLSRSLSVFISLSLALCLSSSLSLSVCLHLFRSLSLSLSLSLSFGWPVLLMCLRSLAGFYFTLMLRPNPPIACLRMVTVLSCGENHSNRVRLSQQGPVAML